MNRIVQIYSSIANLGVSVTYGTAPELIERIANGDEISVFLSDSNKYVKQLKTLNIADQDTIMTIAKNKLVIVAHKNNPAFSTNTEKLWSKSVLKQIHQKGLKFFTAEFNSAPLGRYTRKALAKNGHWNKLKNIITTNSDSTLVVQDIIDNQAIGIIYKSDAIFYADKLKILSEIKGIEVQYTILAVVDNNSNMGKEFIQFMKADFVQDIFNKYFFTK